MTSYQEVFSSLENHEKKSSRVTLRAPHYELSPNQ